jgi:hypothetical protein
MPRLFQLMSLIAALMAVGCLASRVEREARGQTVAVERILASLVCGGEGGPGLVWMENRGDFLRTLSRVKRLDSPSFPGIDFDRFAVLGIFMGNCPSGGYRLSLAGSEVQVQNSTAMVRVNWIVPAPGKIVTQMITSPCLLVKIERGDYSRVEVVDMEGAIRFSIDRP